MSAKKDFKEIFEANPKQDSVIDAVRALSVLAIIAFHVAVGIVHVFDHEKAKKFIIEMPALLQPIWHGEKGVDAFFLLSALVIGLSVFKKLEDYSWKEAGQFLKKKFFRIYPLFVVALVLYALGQWDHFGKYFFSNLFFLNNLVPQERTIIPVGWFLTVEVQYFVLLPLLFMGLKKIKNKGLALTSFFILSIGACLIILNKYSALHQRPMTDLFLAADRGAFSDQMGPLFYESDLTRFGPFILGLLLAYIKVKYSETISRLLKNKGKTVFFVATAMILLPVLMPMYDPDSWYNQPFSATVHMWVLATSRQVFALGICLLMLGCWYSGSIFVFVNQIFNWSIWRLLSRLSFPIYLFHFPFIAVAAVMVLGTTNIKEVSDISGAQGGAIFLLATALTILFSIPLHIYIERPFAERGKKP